MLYLQREGLRGEDLVLVSGVPVLVRILVLFVFIVVAAFVAGAGVLEGVAFVEEALRLFVVFRKRRIRTSLMGDVPLRTTLLAPALCLKQRLAVAGREMTMKDNSFGRIQAAVLLERAGSRRTAQKL